MTLKYYKIEKLIAVLFIIWGISMIVPIAIAFCFDYFGLVLDDLPFSEFIKQSKAYLNAVPLTLTLAPPAITFTLLALYDKHLWKLPILNHLVTIRDISGHYAGTFCYPQKQDTQNSKNSGSKIEEKLCQLWIRQTASHIDVKTMLEGPDGSNIQTYSMSITATIEVDPMGAHTLYFYYHNQGSCLSATPLPAHDGMNVLYVKFPSRDKKVSNQRHKDEQNASNKKVATKRERDKKQSRKDGLILEGFYFSNRVDPTSGRIIVTYQGEIGE